MDTTNLIEWLPFDKSPTEDLCGNTWTATGSPTIGANGAISGNALQLDGSGTFFSNVIISNSEIGLDENVTRATAEINFKPEVFMSWLPTGEIDFKPEVFMSWVPHGEINFKPEVFATLIEGAVPCEFNIDLRRNVTRSETATFDLRRKLINSETANFDLKRTVATGETFSFDLRRSVANRVNFHFDLRRKIANRVEFSADLKRTITSPSEFTVDLRRNLVNSVNFSFDLRAHVYWQWLTRILPESSFLDAKMYAAAEALDVQITKLHQSIREVLHLPRLDELSGTILDLLAEQFHVDYYDAINFSDEEKRNLIRQSIAWHRLKGTPAAVEMVLQDAFKDLRIDEWFTYGGEPYFFRLWCRGYTSTPERFKSFWLMFMDAKNVRSHLEKITIDLSPDDPIKIHTGIAKVVGGLKITGLPKLFKDKSIQLYTDVVRIKSGQKNIGLPKRDRVSKAAVVTGIVIIRNGTVFTGMKYDPLPPDDDFAFSDGDWLRLYFNYPTGRDHPVLLKNPRKDLINGDIKEVGDYAVQNVIFTNQFAEGTLGINRAALIKGFEVTPNADDKLLPNTGELRLFFGFPSGNKHKILLHNRRKDIYLKEIRELGLETAKNNLLVNAYNEKTSGITHVALVRNFVINDENYYQKVTFEEE